MKQLLTLPLLALFFASCVAIDRNNPDDPGSKNYVVRSSSSAVSSSSKAQSSSSLIQTGIIPGTPVTYEGETYETVVIGSRIWMAKNLNYNAPGSKCYNNQESNCKTYGRLYDWNTAMAACPPDWHLPSDADWNALMKFVNPSCSDNSDCAKAATKLKASKGWNAYNGIPPGSDIYGFAALPGGGIYSDGTIDDVGENGVWWSSAEYSANNAYARTMYHNSEFVNRYYIGKSISFYSVRCVGD